MADTWIRLAKHEIESGTASQLLCSWTGDYRRLKVIYNGISSGQGINGYMRFNNDSSSDTNYTIELQDTGGSNTPYGQRDMLAHDVGTATTNQYAVTEIENKSNQEKLVIGHVVNSEGTSAATGLKRRELVGKWIHTGGSITSVQIDNGGSGAFGVGSYLIVLGIGSATTTDEKTTLTNVPVNTQYRETDTRKIYRAIVQADYESDFTSDNWTDKNESGNGLTGVDTTDQRFEFKAHAASAVNDSSVYDLGAGNVSDTQWVLRWEYTWTSKNDGNGNNHAFGLSSKDEQYHTGDTGADYIFMCWGEPQVSSQSNMGVLAGNGTATSSTGHMPNTTSRVQDTSLTSGTTYYMELKRNSATSATFTVKTGSHDGTALSGFPVSNTSDVVSGLSGLRYIKFMNRGGDGNRSGDIIGHINNIEFYNDTTTATKSTVVWKERGTA